MKENKILKITGLTLFVSVIAAVLVAGTYAKYTSLVSGSDSAIVAKWDIKAGQKGSETSINGSNASVSFNLFDTILDETGLAETDVVSGKIAPGTMGSFEFSVKNDSEVNAEYTINFDIDQTNLPLQFKINNGEWVADLDAIPTTRLNIGTSDIVKVQWRWAYESATGDANDTTIGIDAPEINVEATLVVSQVD